MFTNGNHNLRYLPSYISYLVVYNKGLPFESCATKTTIVEVVHRRSPFVNISLCTIQCTQLLFKPQQNMRYVILKSN